MSARDSESPALKVSSSPASPSESFPEDSGVREAVRICWVMWAGLFVMGMGLGVLVSASGLPWWVAPALSGIVFAGSLEFLLVGLLAAASPLSVIASSTLLINARHLVYGISYPLQQVRGPFAKFIAVYMLCDETYALNTGPGSEKLRQSRIMTITVGMWTFWVLGSLLGVVLGSSFLSHLKGIDFVMTAMFLVLAIDSYRTIKDNVCALMAVASAIFALLIAPDSMLLISLVMLVVLLIIRHIVQSKRARAFPPDDIAPSEHLRSANEKAGQ